MIELIEITEKDFLNENQGMIYPHVKSEIKKLNGVYLIHDRTMVKNKSGNYVLFDRKYGQKAEKLSDLDGFLRASKEFLNHECKNIQMLNVTPKKQEEKMGGLKLAPHYKII